MANRTKIILVSLLSGILATGTVPVMAAAEDVAVESENLESGDLEEDSLEVEVETVDIEAIDESVQGTCDKGHAYESIFYWYYDCSRCLVKLECVNCGIRTEAAEATITKKDMAATCTQTTGICYTASVILEEREYSDEKFIPTDPNEKPAGHRLKFVPEKAATCKTKGNLSYYLCENCGEHFKDADGKEVYEKNGWVIQKKAHIVDAGKITTKATTSKEGVRTYTCKACKQKQKYKIPRTAFTYKLGTKSGCIVSKVEDFKSIHLPTSSAYSTTKKAFTLDTKTWRLSPTRNAYKYYKSMKSSIPLMVTTKDGKKSAVKVNFQFQNPEVKITRTYETQAGRGVYRYTFQYDIPGATKIYVHLNTKNAGINNDFNNDFKKYISKPKSDKTSYIRVWKSRADSLGKNGMKFQITAYYGKNKSRTITIAK